VIYVWYLFLYVQIKSILCYNNQTRYCWIVNNKIHPICRGGYMVVTHSSNTQKEWQIENLYRFLKTNCSHKEGLIPITFYIWSFEHSSNIWNIFLLRWILRISSNCYSSKGQIQDYIHYRLGGFYMEGDAI
jgi:hypothetical protein